MSLDEATKARIELEEKLIQQKSAHAAQLQAFTEQEKENLPDLPQNQGMLGSAAVGAGEGFTSLKNGLVEAYADATGNKQLGDQTRINEQGNNQIGSELPSQAARITGKLGAELAATMPLNIIPGMGTIAALRSGRILNAARTLPVQGAAIGAVAPTNADGERITNTVKGLVLGGAGEAALNVLGRGISAYGKYKTSNESMLNNAVGDTSTEQALQNTSDAATRTGAQLPTSTFLPNGSIAQTTTKYLEGMPGIGQNAMDVNQNAIKQVVDKMQINPDKDALLNGFNEIAAHPDTPDYLSTAAQKQADNLTNKDSLTHPEAIAAGLQLGKYRNQAIASKLYGDVSVGANAELGLPPKLSDQDIEMFNTKVLNGDIPNFGQKFVDTHAQLMRDNPDVAAEYKAALGTQFKDAQKYVQTGDVPNIVSTNTTPTMGDIAKAIIEEAPNGTPITAQRLLQVKQDISSMSNPSRGALLAKQDATDTLKQMLPPELQTKLSLADKYYANSVAPYQSPDVQNFLMLKTQEALNNVKTSPKDLGNALISVPSDVKQAWIGNLMNKATTEATDGTGKIDFGKMSQIFDKYAPVVSGMDRATAQAFNDVHIITAALAKNEGATKLDKLISASLIMGSAGMLGGVAGVAGVGGLGLLLRKFAHMGASPEGRQTLIKMRLAAKQPSIAANKLILQNTISAVLRAAIATGMSR